MDLNGELKKKNDYFFFLPMSKHTNFHITRKHTYCL